MKKGFMGLSLYKEIINQLKNNITSINMYSWGEPLLNPDFVSMVEYSKQVNNHIRITTSTNLNISDDKLLAALINSGIDEIIVSCDGASEESYSKYRVNGDYNLVIRNMKFIVSLLGQSNKKTDIIWNFLVFKHNEQEIDAAKEIAESIGVSLRISKMRTFMKDEITVPHAESIKKYKNWIPDKSEYSAYDKENEKTKAIIKTCRKPWQEISINWDGKVFPCCAVYGDEYSFADAAKNDIKQIWNNEVYIQARKEIKDKRIKAVTICGICRNNCFMHM